MNSEKEAFLEFCSGKNYAEKDIELFGKALDFSEKYLKPVKRLCGETQFRHCVNIAKILIENVFFPEVVTAGILYGIEKHFSYLDISHEFGEEIADIVFGQNSFRDIRRKTKDSSDDLVRKILLVGLYDIRIIFVKLADKVDNLRTIGCLPKDDKERIAKESILIYAPLAGRLGFEKIKKSIENLSFKVLNPKKYSEIEDFLKQYKLSQEEFVKGCISEFSDLLGKTGINFAITGRSKGIYSIYKKIVDRGISLDKQKDFFGVRIITGKKEDCYTILGILLENYDAVDGTFKDYITNPKSNGYQSIHVIFDFHGKKVEVQIRTQEMHEVSEEGVASHWSYKKMKSSPDFEKKVGWLKSVLNLQMNDQSDSLKSIKLDIFDNEIYCYTPKGDLVSLPMESTVLDFAYAIHGAVGGSAVAGWVNGKFSSLREKIKSGDVVEVLTNKNQIPRREWLKFVVSSKARDSIRKSIIRREHIPVPHQINAKESDKGVFDSMVYSDIFPDSDFAFAGCCFPVPGDKLAGVIKSYRKILVHRGDCERIKSLEGLVPIFWKESFDSPIMMNIEYDERLGVLAEIINIIVRKGFVIKETKAKLLPEEVIKCSFVIFPKDAEEVKSLIDILKKIRGFRKVYFGNSKTF